MAEGGYLSFSSFKTREYTSLRIIGNAPISILFCLCSINLAPGALHFPRRIQPWKKRTDLNCEYGSSLRREPRDSSSALYQLLPSTSLPHLLTLHSLYFWEQDHLLLIYNFVRASAHRPAIHSIVILKVSSFSRFSLFLPNVQLLPPFSAPPLVVFQEKHRREQNLLGVAEPAANS